MQFMHVPFLQLDPSSQEGNNHADWFAAEYPHRFGNYDNFDFFDCPKGSMQEYPLLHLVKWKPNPDPKKRGDPYYRMDPGGDRILVTFDGMDEGSVK